MITNSTAVQSYEMFISYRDIWRGREVYIHANSRDICYIVDGSDSISVIITPDSQSSIILRVIIEPSEARADSVPWIVYSYLSCSAVWSTEEISSAMMR